MNNKILIILVLVAAQPLAHCERELLWGQKVFPDDGEWLSPYWKKHLVNSEKETGAKSYKVCETQECKRVAEEFISSMNNSVDPCEDFYEFMCGGWSAMNVIPPHSPVWSRFMNVDTTVKNRIKGVLETEPEPSDILPVRRAKKWYRSCVDTETLERRGVAPIESIMMQVGGWPITMEDDEWNADEYTWQKVQRHYTSLTGSYPFFRIKGFPARGSGFGYLYVMSPKKPLTDQLPMGDKEYTGKDYDAYVRLIESAAELFTQNNQGKVSKEKIRKNAKEIVDFEKALSELNKGYESSESTFGNVSTWYLNITMNNTDPKAIIDFASVIQGLFDIVNVKLEPDTKINFSNGMYIRGLSQLLQNTPKRTIVNYVHWTFVGNTLVYTTESMRNILSAYIWKEYGVTQRPPRWYECVKDMKMTHIAAYVFVEKYFPKSTENAVLEMIKNIQNGMEEEIKNSNWLDAESKAIVKDKLNTMRVFLGFPEWYKNLTAISDYYKGITVGTDYFDTMLSYTRYIETKDLKRYLESAKADESWVIDPITVNAVYGPEENSLNLPAADFQDPLFTRQVPNAVNYGIFGVMIGHEMGHGFDSDGIHYGKNGTETELSEQILKSYYQRASCFVDQYEAYRHPKASESEKTTPKLKPWWGRRRSRTEGEDIADTTGIQAVYQAYRNLDKSGVSLRLPGLEQYTEDQLFFLAFGAMWCKVETPQYQEKVQQAFDPHSPARLRVIGSVSNTKDFAKVFNCPKGSPMNPSNKCSIWETSESITTLNPSSMRMEDHPWETQWKP